MRYSMLMVFAVVLGLALIANFGVQAAAKGSGSTAGLQLIGDQQCDGGIRRNVQKNDMDYDYNSTSVGKCSCKATVAQNWTMAYVKANLDAEATKCWCQTLGAAEIATNTTLINDVCKDFISEVVQTTTVNGFASGVVVTVNIVLKAAISIFADKEMHTSVSGKDGSVMFKVAVTQFL